MLVEDKFYEKCFEEFCNLNGVRNMTKARQTLINTGFKSVTDSDSYDWKDYGVDSTIKMVVDNKQLNNGSIILMHIGANDTADSLEPIIVVLQDKGYEIVPVSKLIYTGKYTVDKTGRQFGK